MHSAIGTSTAPRHTCCADCPPAPGVHSTRPSSSMFPQMWNRTDNPCRFPHPTCRPPFRFPLFTLECARGLNTSIVPSKLIFAADILPSGGPAPRPEPARCKNSAVPILYPLSSISSPSSLSLPPSSIIYQSLPNLSVTPKPAVPCVSAPLRLRARQFLSSLFSLFPRFAVALPGTRPIIISVECVLCCVRPANTSSHSHMMLAADLFICITEISRLNSLVGRLENDCHESRTSVHQRREQACI